ncbi:hypothetical protein Moror_12216 [Moniliophthora roreri MCA 2997]|uniref:Uncharacterized protein n=2 Tax=Moniliophthora roreri TaxID=221103 RepID=V2WQ55_MONRO|nr:hypothetical protein Moror_12216 [Moniliophthora roreri MCA 2997]
MLRQAQTAEHLIIDGFNVSDLPASEPAWIGTREIPPEKLPPVLKLRYFLWNGKTTVILLDRMDQIWAVLGSLLPKAKD